MHLCRASSYNRPTALWPSMGPSTGVHSMPSGLYALRMRSASCISLQRSRLGARPACRACCSSLRGCVAWLGRVPSYYQVRSCGGQQRALPVVPILLSSVVFYHPTSEFPWLYLVALA